MHLMRTYEPFGGRLFFQPLKVAKGTRPVTLSHTWETDEPFRFSPWTVVTRIPFFRFFPWTVVIRIPFRAVAFGWWRDTPVQSLPEERAEHQKKEREEAEFDAYRVVNGDVSRDEWDTARRIIADRGLDPDDEMEIMQALGVMG